MVTLGDLVPISSTRSMKAPSHFLYADDVLLFGRASVSSLTNIVEAFRLYGSLSSQDVNWEMSFIYCGKGIPYGVASSLLSLSRIRRDGSSMIYLGSPLFVGASRCRWL